MDRVQKQAATQSDPVFEQKAAAVENIITVEVRMFCQSESALFVGKQVQDAGAVALVEAKQALGVETADTLPVSLVHWGPIRLVQADLARRLVNRHISILIEI